MRKLILWGIILLVNFWIVSAYLPLTETQLSTIDSEINSNQHLTYAEKKAKSEYFYWLAEKNLAIRKAFSSISTKITKVNLSEKDNETVNYRINILPECFISEIISLILDSYIFCISSISPILTWSLL